MRRCAIALIGTLPDTLADRSIAIDLKRRLTSEQIEPFRFDRVGHLEVLARKAARWAADNADRIGAVDPAMPVGILNREADNWRPLLAIAEAAGGEWPERAAGCGEAACGRGRRDASLIELLLGDIRDIFAGERVSVDRITVRRSGRRPWSASRGGPGPRWARPEAADRRIGWPGCSSPWASRRTPFGSARRTPKGYYLHQFEDAFARYLRLRGGFRTATPQQRR